ncbi:MAG TPA: hypothetical protein VI248_25045 [Kineosporiaceae bacterium]
MATSARREVGSDPDVASDVRSDPPRDTHPDGQHLEGAAAAPGGRGAGIGVNASLPPLPGVGQVDPKRLLWWGGLATAGALGVLEWPVVAAVGVGSYVAERFARSDRPEHPVS